MIFFNSKTNEYLKLLRTRKSGINTYIQVDEKGNKILKKRSWSANKQPQLRLIKEDRVNKQKL